ncbi:MAG: GNAT family N-acetyltransferase [Lachnospiraceae bacterium]|nr:GNAT family N-acetyltransferase [Lachnospiraceae bacterium]
MKREHNIVALPKEEWKGVPIPLCYTTEEYFDVEITETPDAYEAKLVRKKFETPVTHSPEEYDFPDGLYQDHWEKAEAYGMYSEENGERKLLACIEVCPEEWSNRLMVTELWVDDSLHRQGIGTALMNKAKEIAKAQGRRAIILETQSCNVRAIAFYKSQGFQLMGFDTCCYTNRDIERREVRFNLVYFMDNREGRF